MFQLPREEKYLVARRLILTVRRNHRLRDDLHTLYMLYIVTANSIDLVSKMVEDW